MRDMPTMYVTKDEGRIIDNSEDMVQHYMYAILLLILFIIRNVDLLCSRV